MLLEHDRGRQRLADRSETAGCADIFSQIPRELHPNGAVLEFGFDPDQASVARGLIQAGMRPIWFAGDHDRARQLFVARGTVPEFLFDKQVQRIKEADLPRSMPELQVVSAFRDDGSVRAPEEIYAEILLR